MAVVNAVNIGLRSSVRHSRLAVIKSTFFLKTYTCIFEYKLLKNQLSYIQCDNLYTFSQDTEYVVIKTLKNQSPNHKQLYPQQSPTANMF